MLRDLGQKAFGTTSSRPRRLVKLLLNESKDDELEILIRIDELKRKRQWLPSFRNAMRLFFSLREGRTDVLKELFPGIVEAIARPPASEEYERMMQAIAELMNNRQVPVMAAEPRVRPTLDDFDIADLDDQPTQVVPSVNVLDNFFNSFEGYD